MAAMSDWDGVLKCWPALDWRSQANFLPLVLDTYSQSMGHVPDDPFDPTPWFSMFYNDVDLDAIDWADEMRKLPGQFTQRLYFPGSPDQRIIAEGVYEMTGATL